MTTAFAHLGIHLVNLALQLLWQPVDIDGLLWTLALLVPCMRDSAALQIGGSNPHIQPLPHVPTAETAC